jgi:glycosyltransferase involved in cell wall biosynthesis
VVPHPIVAEPGPADPAGRSGLLLSCAGWRGPTPWFLDLQWFLEAVYPSLLETLDAPLQCTIHGLADPPLSPLPEGVEISHPTAPMAPLLERCRLLVEPSPGAPGQQRTLLWAAAHGLPIVTSEPAAKRLGWQDRCQLLACRALDAAHFVQQIELLYRSDELWRELRAQALARIAEDHGWQRLSACLAAALDLS